MEEIDLYFIFTGASGRLDRLRLVISDLSVGFYQQQTHCAREQQHFIIQCILLIQLKMGTGYINYQM